MIVLAALNGHMDCKIFSEPEPLLCLTLLAIVNVNRSCKFRGNSDIGLDLNPLTS